MYIIFAYLINISGQFILLLMESLQMGKIKVKNSNLGLQVECKMPGAAVEVIPAFNMTKGIEGIAIPSSFKKKSVVYVLPPSVSLQSLLDSEIEDSVFFTLILHLLDVFQATIDRKIAVCKLHLPLNEIFFSNIHSLNIFYFPYADVFESNDACISNFLKNLCACKRSAQNSSVAFSAFMQFINERRAFDFADYLNFLEQYIPGLIDSCINLNFKSVVNCASEQSGSLNPFTDDTVCLAPPASLRSGDAPAALSDFQSDSNVSPLSVQSAPDRMASTENTFSREHLDLDATVPLTEDNSHDLTASGIHSSSVFDAVDVTFSTAVKDEFTVSLDETGETTNLHSFEQGASPASAVNQDKNQAPLISSDFSGASRAIDGNCNSGNTVLLSDVNSQSQKAVKTVKLIFVSSGQSIQFAKQNFHVGSDPMCCDFSVQNPSVSKIHLTIYYEGDNYYVRDNGSTNGTTLNGKKLVPHQPCLLHNYDRIVMANEIIDFQIIEGQPEV